MKPKGDGSFSTPSSCGLHFSSPPAPLPAAAESTAESAGAPFAVTYGEQGSPLRASGPVWNCDLVSSLSAAGSAGTKGDEGDAGRDGGVGGG